MALHKGVRTEWDSYDLITKSGIKIEVKSSGYIQTWSQARLSSIRFGIRPTLGWDPTTNKYEDKKVRQSDVYVFCVHKHMDQETVNPLDVDQWDFYVIRTQVLNEKVPNQKSISLSGVIKLGAMCVTYEALGKTIESVLE